jgi:hypothetical protein
MLWSSSGLIDRVEFTDRRDRGIQLSMAEFIE